MILKPHKNVAEYVKNINGDLLQLTGKRMTSVQVAFLGFCITSMIYLGALNFAAMSRAMLGTWSALALSMMLHRSKISYNLLLRISAQKLLTAFGIRKAHVVIDDFDRSRSKCARFLFGLFKSKDKKTGGYSIIQSIVLVLLVTEKFSIPIFFSFYRPDPRIRKWEKEKKQLKSKGKKITRPKPKRLSNFPTKLDIALTLLKRCRSFLAWVSEDIKVISISADSVYFTSKSARFVTKIFPGSQFISKLAKSQIVWNKTRKRKSLEQYFKNQVPLVKEIKIRGEIQRVHYCSARLFLQATGSKVYVIALRYEGEKEYRYLVATDLTWCAEDIIRAYAFRWLVEVAIFDSKQYDGWGRKASQQGADGACRGVFLSLLVDHFLLQHPRQLDRIRTGRPLYTAGTIARLTQFETIIDSIKEAIESPDPKKMLRELSESVLNVVEKRTSTKHLSGMELEGFEVSVSLQRKFANSA